jgi:hypothetical protein
MFASIAVVMVGHLVLILRLFSRASRVALEDFEATLEGTFE